MNVWCVGRNYADHAKELGNEVPTEPLIFLKAGSTVTTGAEIIFPRWAEEIHHELEIALQFGPDLNFSAMALALDLTERAAQNCLKAKGQPWTLAKSFTGSCPMTRSIPLEDPSALRLQLRVNGSVRQDAMGSLMIHPAETLRLYVLERFPVRPGDWLLTGTPAGVAAIQPGDELLGTLDLGGRILIEAKWQVRA